MLLPYYGCGWTKNGMLSKMVIVPLWKFAFYHYGKCFLLSSLALPKR